MLRDCAKCGVLLHAGQYCVDCAGRWNPTGCLLVLIALLGGLVWALSQLR